jgi:hypothetical protein
MTIEELQLLCWRKTTPYTHKPVSYALCYRKNKTNIEIIDYYDCKPTLICTIPHDIFKSINPKDILALVNAYIFLNMVHKPGIGVKIKKISAWEKETQ